MEGVDKLTMLLIYIFDIQYQDPFDAIDSLLDLSHIQWRRFRVFASRVEHFITIFPSFLYNIIFAHSFNLIMRYAQKSD